MIPLGRYEKPWIAEQWIDLDLPGGAGRRWLPGPTFATEVEAWTHIEHQRAISSPLEAWRVRNREAT